MKLRHILGYSAPFLALARKILGSLFLNKENYGYVRVLMFHHISPEQFKIFEKIIHNLASKYKFITPEESKRFIDGKYKPKSTNILITFDDGFKSNLVAARKVLNPLGIKGIFFIPSEFIDMTDRSKQKEFIAQNIYDNTISEDEVSADMLPLNWPEVKKLLEDGHTIGGHTKSHRRISILGSDDLLRDEITQSADRLEKKLDIEIRHFAYPFGDIDSIDKQALKLIKKRYQYCFSGVRGANYYPTPSYAILRDVVNVDDPELYTRFIIEGGLDFLYQKKVKNLRQLAQG